MMDWFSGRSQRDQGLLVLMVVVVVATVLFVGVWEPLRDARQASEQQLETAVNEAMWVSLTAQEAQTLARTPVRAQVERGSESLLALVDRTARAHGLGTGLKRAEPAGPRAVRIWFEDVPFDQALDWLQALNAAYGIHAGELMANRLSPDGRVNTNLTLRELQQ